MNFRIVQFGDAQRLAGEMRMSADAAEDTFPVVQRVIMDMLRVEGILFRSNGRRGGGSWAHLRPNTVKKKGNTKILRTSGSNPGYSVVDQFENANTLFNSLVMRGAPFQILEFTKDHIEFGTERPGASAHQFGNPRKHVPARPIIRFLPEDYDRWAGFYARHTMRPFTKLRF